MRNGQYKLGLHFQHGRVLQHDKHNHHLFNTLAKFCLYNLHRLVVDKVNGLLSRPVWGRAICNYYKGCTFSYCHNLVIAILVVSINFLYLWQQCSQNTIKQVLDGYYPCDSFPTFSQLLHQCCHRYVNIIGTMVITTLWQ